MHSPVWAPACGATNEYHHTLSLPNPWLPGFSESGGKGTPSDQPHAVFMEGCVQCPSPHRTAHSSGCATESATDAQSKLAAEALRSLSISRGCSRCFLREDPVGPAWYVVQCGTDDMCGLHWAKSQKRWPASESPSSLKGERGGRQ